MNSVFSPSDRSSGPDAQETVVQNIGDVSMTFFASELRLRGDAYIAQPHRDEQGNVLCWNGEVRTAFLLFISLWIVIYL